MIPGMAPGRRAKGARLGAAGLAVALTLGAARPAVAGSLNWSTRQAVELTRQGAAALEQGRTEDAARRFLEAIRFDATHGPAYLALGNMYERKGEPDEAARTYAVGIERAPTFTPLHVARGSLLLRLGRAEDAAGDLRVASSLEPDEPAILRDLAAALARASAMPAALCVSRRLEALALSRGDAALAAEARTRVRALALLVAEGDPVTAGADASSAVRRALARHAQRRGP